MTTPLARAPTSASLGRRSTSTTYRFAFFCDGRSSASLTRPSDVNNTNPVESLSSRPTVKTRCGSRSKPPLAMMLLRSEASDVHVTPLGFQYLT